ncbi:O-methyltransferase [Sinorhizobium fredii]|jgi:O-methyltransferase|uniref:Putative methyltransferase n=2 Tax=Sinorhizobium/Ensifer group TaxID=227292 RepID=I3X0H0_SINF2|nr:putative methyltransferase [Sinorhizobium fredii USDA 257]PDT85351.1 methyltransferase [Sinorhizobium sp. BJ1]
MGMREFKRRVNLFLNGDKALPGFHSDNVRVVKKNLGFLDEPRFKTAWEFGRDGNKHAFGKKRDVPDIRWRAHVCCWAASNALNLEGDFVEFGVNGGLVSMTVCDYLDFGKQNRSFWLFDTFAGIPTESLSGEAEEKAKRANDGLYSDVFEIAKRNFSKFANARLVRGNLPGTLDASPVGKIAYLHVDLNVAKYEKQCIERVWDRIVPGAPIVLDDYAFQGHEDQYEMWNEFTAARGHMVLTLPTGQGMIIKH